MTVNNLQECKANAQTVDQLSVARLPDKPNSPTSMGGGNLSAAELKARFDGIGKYLALQYNKLIEFLSEKVQTLSVTDPIDNQIKSLADALENLSAPAGTAVTVNIGSSSMTVQSALNALSNTLNSLSGGALLKSGAVNMDPNYVPASNGSIATKKYVDDTVSEAELRVQAGTINMNRYAADGLIVGSDNKLNLNRADYATALKAGLVKVGNGLRIDSNGALSPSDGITVAEPLSGDQCYIPDSDEGSLDRLIIKGKTNVGEDRNFNYPSSLDSVAAQGGVMIRSSNKNLLKFGLSSATSNGLTLAVSDGIATISSSGTVSTDTEINLGVINSIKLYRGVTYTLSVRIDGVPYVQDTSKVGVKLKSGDDVIAAATLDSNYSFVPSADVTVYAYLFCLSGVSISSNTSMLVQLERGDESYFEPHRDSAQTIVPSVNVSNPYLDGVGGVADIADSASGKIVRAFRRVVLTGQHSVAALVENHSLPDGVTGEDVVTYDFYIDVGLGAYPPASGALPVCSHFKNGPDYEYGWASFSNGYLVLHVPSSAVSEHVPCVLTDEVTSIPLLNQWLSSAVCKLIYRVAAPFCEDIASTELVKMRSVATFSGGTQLRIGHASLSAEMSLSEYSLGTGVKKSAVIKSNNGVVYYPITTENEVFCADGRLLSTRISELALGLDAVTRPAVNHTVTLSSSTSAYTASGDRFILIKQISGLTVDDVILPSGDDELWLDLDMRISQSNGAVTISLGELPRSAVTLTLTVIKGKNGGAL